MSTVDRPAPRRAPPPSARVRVSLADRAVRLRDRILSDPAFIRRAGSTLLGRAISRREARALFDVTAGFVYSQVLVAAIRLDLFRILFEAPLAAADLSRRLGLPEASTERLLAAAEPLKLVERRSGGRWGLGRRGAAVLGNPGLVAMVEHHDLLYRELADPVALLKRGVGASMSAFWPYARADTTDRIEPAAVDAYSRLMSASQHFVAGEVLAAYPFGRHRHLLDVGGGEGVFAQDVAARHPNLEITVFDLEPVAARAATRFADAGLGDRARAVGGDFLRGTLPGGADVVSLVRIIHDHDDAAALALLNKVAGVLPPGGTLVVAEPMAGSAAAPGIAAYFSIYLFAMGSGRPRSATELKELLSAAGFGSIRLRRDRNPTATRVITAKRRN